MAKVILRPATRDDLLQFVEYVPFRCLFAIVGECDDGSLLGVGGVAVLPDGRKMAFSELRPEARRHAVSLHKAGRRLIQLAKERGLKDLIATSNTTLVPAGARWLARLGFEKRETQDKPIWVWTNNDLR